jgi:hypothetical protein
MVYYQSHCTPHSDLDRKTREYLHKGSRKAYCIRLSKHLLCYTNWKSGTDLVKLSAAWTPFLIIEKERAAMLPPRSLSMR